MEPCVLYLARATEKFKMNYGDQSIKTAVLCSQECQFRQQTEHTERKPRCQCGIDIPHGTSVHHDITNLLLQLHGFVSEQRQINKSDSYMSYICIYRLYFLTLTSSYK